MSSEAPTMFVRRASGLVRTVGPFTAFMICFTHTVGGGIHKLSVTAAYQYPAAFVPWSFLIVGLIAAIPTALVYTIMGAMMPRTGGDYIFITRGLSPALGFIASWGFWFTEVLSYGIIAWYSIDFFTGAVTAAGIALRDEGLLSTAAWMNTMTGHIVLSLIFVIVFGAIAFLGMRIYGWIINILGTIAILGCLSNLVILSIWGSNPVNAVAAFNSMFGANAYQKIVAKAFELGSPPVQSFSWAATINAGVGAIWAYIGIVSAVFVGGEIKTPATSLLVAQIFGTLVIMAYYITLPFLFYTSWQVPQSVLQSTGAMSWLQSHGVPADRVYFTALYAYVYNKLGVKGLADLMGIPPTHVMPWNAVTSFTIPLVPKGLAWLQIFNGFVVGIILLKDIPAFFVVASRMVFAWAFDRFFPEVFAAVNETFHSPHWAILLTMLGGLAGVLLIWANGGEEGAWVAAADTSNLYQFAVMTASLAGAVLPYVKSDLYEKSPIRWEIGGVPVVSIIGAFSFAVNFFFFMVSSAELGVDIWFQQSFWMGLGAFMFAGFLIYNQRRGIDVRTIYTEIPPA